MHTAALQKLLRNSLRSVTRPLSLNPVLRLLVHATPPQLCLVWFGVLSLQSPVFRAPCWSLTARGIDSDNINTSISIGIGSILMGRDWYFSSFSPFRSGQIGPVSSQDRHVSANTLLLRLALHTLLLLFCCSAPVMWLSSSQRETFCWWLMQSLIMVERKRIAVWSSSTWSTFISIKSWYRYWYRRYWSCIYLILQYHTPTDWWDIWNRLQFWGAVATPLSPSPAISRRACIRLFCMTGLILLTCVSRLNTVVVIWRWRCLTEALDFMLLILKD